MFGGHGSSVMVDIVQRIDQSGADVQLILICGHNQRLEAELKALVTAEAEAGARIHSKRRALYGAVGFLHRQARSWIDQRSSAIPFAGIVECNGKTLPQERYNAQWVAEMGFGIVVPTFREIAPAVQRLIEPSTFGEFLRKTNTYSNRALFEVAEILEQCYENDSHREIAQTQRACRGLSLAYLSPQQPH